MDEERRRESLKLWDVMNRVGANERMRRLHRDVGIRHEIMQTVTNYMVGMNLSMYRFGSSCEGTTTPGMKSDTDVVCCDENRPVIEDIQQAPSGWCHLLVADKHTKPGYVKLQVVCDGKPLNKQNCKIRDQSAGMYDNVGRVCRKHYTGQGHFKSITERNGPADTILDTPGCTPLDQVHAYRSRACPPSARGSLLDCTRTGWLTTDEVDEMVNFGCLFVGVGHQTSYEKGIEWRISFSLQERQLMFKLNPTQHVCYVLLKIIKNMITSRPDLGNSITSYHMKTCLFRVNAKIDPDTWTPENLIDCISACLREMLQCLHNGNLPSFFITENNIFERRVHGPVRERLISQLQEILLEGCGVFYRIQSDSIGELLRGNVDLISDVTFGCGISVYDMYKDSCRSLIKLRRDIFKHLTKHSSTDAELFLRQQLDYIVSVNTITEHSQEATKSVVCDMEPVLYQLHAQQLASLAFSTDVRETRDRLLQASARSSRLGMAWNHMIGRLVSATILYRQGNIETCRNLLVRLEQALCEDVMSLCGCYDFQQYGREHLAQHLLSGHTDPQSVMESYMAVCAAFLPTHIEILPSPLKFEFYRSVGTPPESRDDFFDNWYDWAVVDFKVYLYFLQYLVYSYLSRHREKQIATENLKTVLQQDDNLGHRETGYNLLGWIYCQEGHIQTAAYCFLLSWRIRPHHNAAKWHMLILMYQQFVICHR